MQALVVNEACGTTTVYNLDTLETYTTFKDNSDVSRPNTLCCLENDYCIWANVNKPTLNVFSINRTAQQAKKKVMPGKVQCACVSNDGRLLCCGIGENIMLWDLISGDMIASMSKHYRAIKKVQFVSNSRYIVAAGLDGVISVWSIPHMKESGETHHTEPKASLQLSLQDIADIWCSPCSGAGVKVYVASSKHVRVLDLEKKSIVSAMYFDTNISSICVDECETTLYVGCRNGYICEVDLAIISKDPALSSLKELNLTIDSGHDFISWKTNAHSAEVSSLVVLMGNNGPTFISGSHDNTFKVWDAWSVQCNRSIDLGSAVCSMGHYTFKPSVLDTKHKPSFELPSNFLPSDKGSADGVVDFDTENQKVRDVCVKFDDCVHLILTSTDLEKKVDDLNDIKNKYQKNYEKALDNLIPSK